MPRGKVKKRGWVGRGVISNNGGKCSQQLEDTSQTNTLKPLTPSQGVNFSQHVVSSNENGLHQSAHASATIATEREALPSQVVTGEQTTLQYIVSSNENGLQQPAHTSVNSATEKEALPSQVVIDEQTTHASQRVSSQQAARASHATTYRRARQIVVRGVRHLTINGETFFPHDVLRDVTTAFKKSFAGPWYSWKKVPPHVQNQWFSDFEKNYSYHDEEKDLIRATFNQAGSDRLSDILGKAKRKYRKTNQTPNWIGQIHWEEMMEYWNSDDFKRTPRIECHVIMEKKELTGEELPDIQLYLKTNRTEDKEWICGKSQRVWDTVIDNVKKNIDITDTPRDENGSEVGDGEINIPTNEDEEVHEDDIVKMLQAIPKEQFMNTWIDAAGGTKKRKIYGLALETGVLRDSLHVGSASSSAHPAAPNVPLQQILEQPQFEEFINRLLEDRIASMQASMVRICVRLFEQK